MTIYTYMTIHDFIFRTTYIVMFRNCLTAHIGSINVNVFGGRYKDRQTDTHTYYTQKQFQETSHTLANDWHVFG